MGEKMGKLLICDAVAASAVEAIRAAGVEVDVRDDIMPKISPRLSAATQVWSSAVGQRYVHR